jgi:hypothetical protein
MRSLQAATRGKTIERTGHHEESVTDGRRSDLFILAPRYFIQIASPAVFDGGLAMTVVFGRSGFPANEVAY